MSFVPKPQEIYKHFKGNLYQIITVAEHSETGRPMVIYQALYGEFKTYARDLDMFISPVDKVKYPEATQEFRFELQGPDSARQKEECGTREAVQEPEKETLQEAGQQPGKEPLQEAEQRPGKEPLQEAEQRPEKEPLQEPAQEVQPEPDLDPVLVEFLDADTYEEKLNLLAALHHRITQDMITTMAVASDIEVEEGELEERYTQLKNCLLTLEKYECKRLR